MSGRASSAAQSSERLADRRRRSRRRGLLSFGILLLTLIGVLAYGMWQAPVRIAHVTVYGADQSLAGVATAAMHGTYFGIIPRDSAFFVPETQIRSLLTAAHPDIAAVSIFRSGLTGLSIKVDYRVPIARWCGSPSPSAAPEDSPLKEVVPAASGDCYLFDASGFLYATATEPFFATEGTSSPLSADGSNPDKTLSPFVLFDPLPAGAMPIGATLGSAEQMSSIFDLARQIGSFGSPVRAIVIRDGEADLFLATPPGSAATGPRITYLLGDEQNAFTALVSAKSKLDLSDPTLQYVDLRFGGKIYLKRNTP